MNLTTRQQEILQRIQSDPIKTLQEIGDDIGVSREYVRQVANVLEQKGVLGSRVALKLAAIEAQKKSVKGSKEHKKLIWRKMMYIRQRMVYRFKAQIDRFGLASIDHMPGSETACRFKDCTRYVRARGYCNWHYSVLRSSGALWVRRRSKSRCKEDNCFRTVYARRMCHTCYNRFMRHNSGTSVNHTSKFRGVSWAKKDKRWVAYIYPDGKQKYLGSFISEEMAARAYDTAARQFIGESAKLNFPNENIEIVNPVKEVQKSAKQSGVRGIVWSKRYRKWEVRIYRHGKCLYVGRFIDLDTAIATRKAEAAS